MCFEKIQLSGSNFLYFIKDEGPSATKKRAKITDTDNEDEEEKDQVVTEGNKGESEQKKPDESSDDENIPIDNSREYVSKLY